MQLLIDKWNKELQQPLGVLEDHRAYHTSDIKEANRQVRELNKRIDQATELLETEREQIIVAHANGIEDASRCLNGEPFKTSEQYYKDTYQ